MKKQLSHLFIRDEIQVDLHCLLGQGSTGKVYKGYDLRTNEEVAVKMIDLEKIDNEVAKYLLEMEKIAIMSVNNPFVLRGLKIVQDSNFCFIATELLNGGTLKEEIKKSRHGFLTEERTLKILHCLIEGYKKLREKKIFHRDLKPANIMFHNGNPKIIDFGYCEVEGSEKPSLNYNVGSPSYMAPETFEENVYNESTEIWSLGVIVYECLTGHTFDKGRHMSIVYKEIESLGIYYPSHVSPLAKRIINWCLSINPTLRPNCDELLETFFAKKVSSKSLASNLKIGSENCDKKISNWFPQQKYNWKQLPIEEVRLEEKKENVINSTKVCRSKVYKIPEFLQGSINLKLKENEHFETKPSFTLTSDRPIRATFIPKQERAEHSIERFKSRSPFTQRLMNVEAEEDKRILYYKRSDNKLNIRMSILKPTDLLTKSKNGSAHKYLVEKMSTTRTPLKFHTHTFSKEMGSRNRHILTERDVFLRA